MRSDGYSTIPGAQIKKINWFACVINTLSLYNLSKYKNMERETIGVHVKFKFFGVKRKTIRFFCYI